MRPNKGSPNQPCNFYMIAAAVDLVSHHTFHIYIPAKATHNAR
jgi:hypothetical protein